jgi:hypothetical protein
MIQAGPSSWDRRAGLSRRCLQNMLHEGGYKARDLSKEIDLLLNETRRQRCTR